jgi:hypothetical protein
MKSCKALSNFVDESNGSIELCRIARVLSSLYCAGIYSDKFENSIDCLVQRQWNDGGWADPEETAWSAGLVGQIKGSGYPSYAAAIQWLRSNRSVGGTWGKNPRDRARIPTTVLVLTLVPEAGCDDDYIWVAQEWAKDLSGSVQLSYKAGFYLLVAGHPSIQGDSILIDRTVKHLIDDQNEDGGFAPWKNHPIGSDPWSTGVVLWGLSKWIDRIDPAVINRALHWLEVTQLPSGYWPYHYLDEGTSYALIGAVSAMRAMASRK